MASLKNAKNKCASETGRSQLPVQGTAYLNSPQQADKSTRFRGPCGPPKMKYGLQGWSKSAQHASFLKEGNCACCAEAHVTAVRLLGTPRLPRYKRLNSGTRRAPHTWDFSCSATPGQASSLSQACPAVHFLGHTNCPSPTLFFFVVITLK